MNYLKKNWGVFLIILIALIPVYQVISMLDFDFSGESEQMISWQTMPAPPAGGPGGEGFPQGEAPEAMPEMGQQEAMPSEPGEQIQEGEMVAAPEGEFTPPAGGMPERTMLHMALKKTGDWAIKFLVLILSYTPIALLTGFRAPFKIRQTTGITAFTIVFFHFIFFLYDEGISHLFWNIGLLAGFIAGTVMLPLALTSGQFAIRRLKKKWKKLHRFAYLAGFLSVVHIVMEHSDEWAIYTTILAIGFIVRLPFIQTPLKNYWSNRRIAKAA